MSTTITAEATAADLLAELRELVNRYDGADTLDDVRQLADEVTARLRRARGRISRIVKAEASPAPVVEPKPAAEPTSADTKPAPAPPVAKQPADLPVSRVTLANAPARPRPTPRRRVTSFSIALAVLTVVSSLWSTTSTRTRHGARRTGRAMHATGRRAGRLATTLRSTLARLGGAS